MMPAEANIKNNNNNKPQWCGFMSEQNADQTYH